MSYVLYVCYMFILLSNLLTYESHIKSYVLENMSYMSYVLYICSVICVIRLSYVSQKIAIFGKFLNFQTVPISYVFVICHIFFICFSYVSHMFVICRLPSSDTQNGKLCSICLFLPVPGPVPMDKLVPDSFCKQESPLGILTGHSDPPYP